MWLVWWVWVHASNSEVDDQIGCQPPTSFAPFTNEWFCCCFVVGSDMEIEAGRGGGRVTGKCVRKACVLKKRSQPFESLRYSSEY
jgi:hypothetical protein